MSGWMKIHRSMLTHWVSDDPMTLALWMRFLLEANHSESKKQINGSLVTVKRGQLIFGLDSYAVKTGISKQVIRKRLDMLLADGMVTRKKHSKFSIISIVNYESYQEQNTQKTPKEQAQNKQTTSTEQHYKNVKNVENGKEVDPLSVSQAKADEDYTPVIERWNQFANQIGLPTLRMFNATRRAKVNSAYKNYRRVKKDLNEEPNTKIQFLLNMIGVAEATHKSYHLGLDGGWQLNFDYLLQKKVIEHVAETKELK